MKLHEIGAFEAKTRLSELLDKVERGQSFQITKRGKPVALLKPIEERSEKEPQSLSKAFAEIRKRSKPGPGIKELIHMGHKY